MFENIYYYMKEALSVEQCNEIIELGLSKIEEKGTTFGNRDTATLKTKSKQNNLTVEEMLKQGIEVETSVLRDSAVSWISEKWVFDLINPLIDEANKKSSWNFDIDSWEDAQFTVYKDNGFYGWHTDGNGDHIARYKPYIQGYTNVDMKKNGKLPHGYTQSPYLMGKVRKLSVTINLTNPNEYEGGNLMFDLGPHQQNRFKECVEGRPQGSVIVFPSSMYHCVTPVTSGKRISLVNWRLGGPFK